MSDFDTTQLAAILAAELGLPHAIVRWACPFGLGAGLTPALRRAIRALTLEPRGGLLVVHLERGRSTPNPERAQAALLATLDRARVTEAHSVLCADGLVIACTLAPALQQLPSSGDRAPVTGTDLTTLRLDAASRLSPLARPAQRGAIDEDLTPDERILVSVGAATFWEDALVPTIAGMVAFGNEPATFLGGLHAIIEGNRTRQVSGDPISLVHSISETLRLTEPIAGVLHALVLHSLLERSWMPRLDDEPIALLAVGDHVELRWPVCSPARGSANPILRRLLRARGVLNALAEAPERLERWLWERGGSVVIDREGDECVAHMRLPRAKPAPAISQKPTLPRPTKRAPPGPPPIHPLETESRDVRVLAPEPLRCAVQHPHAIPRSTSQRSDSPSASLDTRPVETRTPHEADPAFLPRVPADSRDTVLLDLFARQEPLSARDIMQTLGWSRSTTRDVLARLVAAGALAGTALSPRSPHQSYVRLCPP